MPEPRGVSYEITVALADTGDLPTLERLFAGMQSEQQDARGGRLWTRLELRELPISESLASSIASGTEWVWLGCIDDVPFGFACLRLLDLGSEILGELRELYVEKEARSIGIGELLMDAVEAKCQELGCSGIDAAVLPGNRASKNFMESRGLKARLIRVHRDL